MSHASLKPRNGHTLIVGIVARISGCQSQKELSLEDQTDHGKEVIAEIYDGPVEFRVIATKGKGERLDRPELQEIEEMLRTDELDVLSMEDVGRLVRGGAAVRLWGIAVDHGTRCIAAHDCVDTAEDTWEEDLLSACRDHVGHQSHTSKRIKKKLMNRFKKHGGSVATPPAGYLKPDGAKTYDDWIIDEKAESAKLPNGDFAIVEGARRLKVSLNCSEVADWFNQIGFRPGKYCRRSEWDGRMIRRFYRNPILKGFPGRGFKHTIKHHETGRRIAVTNPQGPAYYECPHLVYLEPDVFDELNFLLDQRNAKYQRRRVNGTDPLHRVPRKRTRFPGQHARCYYCGYQCVWGGNGMTDNLMCANSREWHCWNSMGFNGGLLTQRLWDEISKTLDHLEGFDAQFREMVEKAHCLSGGNVADLRRKLSDKEIAHRRAWENMNSAIKQFGALPQFQEEIEELKKQATEIAIEKARLESQTKKPLEFPKSIAQLKDALMEEFSQLSIDSPEFGMLLRQLVPDVSIYLVRLCDGGHPLPRARVELDLLGSIEDAALVPDLKESLSRVITFDVFEPPQRERIRVESNLLRDAGHGPKAIAKMLTEKPKYQTVSKALELHDLMLEMELNAPYIFIDAPPEDYKKLRRHRNPKYKFKPLDGYHPPVIKTLH